MGKKTPLINYEKTNFSYKLKATYIEDFKRGTKNKLNKKYDPNHSPYVMT